MDSKIELLRQKIDLIDTDLQQLLQRRWELARQISLIKEDLGVEVYSPDREKEIFLKIMARYKDSPVENSLLEVYQQILKESRLQSIEARNMRKTIFSGSSTGQ